MENKEEILKFQKDNSKFHNITLSAIKKFISSDNTFKENINRRNLALEHIKYLFFKN